MKIKIMIDKRKLDLEIHEAAQMYLSDIAQMSEDELRDNLKYFAEKCKKIAEGILEQYVFANVSKYAEGKFSIQDVETLGKFVDFQTGYQAQMLQWIEAHPLEVKEETFEFPPKPVGEDDAKSVPPKAIFIGGTVLAVGLFIFTNIWIALGAELLAILFAKVQSMRIQKSAAQRKMEMEHYATALQDKKNEMINGMLVELEKWLDLGVEKSKEILSMYNL